MKASTIIFLTITTLAISGVAKADITVNMQAVSDSGSTESLGSVVISEAAHGLVFTPALIGLTSGLHGFHVHENASCEPAENDGRYAQG